MQVETISILGLGKLGASMLCGFASRGFKVIGHDINSELLRKIDNAETPVNEPHTAEYFAEYKSLISTAKNNYELISRSQITFIVVPTPSDNTGRFSLNYATDAFKKLGKALRQVDRYHVFVLTSTVLPGDSRETIIPAIENASGKICGIDFGFCYNPEFIALGTVIRDFLNPDFYLLGEFDERSGDALEFVHNKTALNRAPVKRMSLENAEIAKISVNSFVTLKVSFANMLSQICHYTPNSNVDVVSDALGMDTRIGRKYMTGGLNFAGPCFPRDNRALAMSKTAANVDTRILSANDDYNFALAGRVINEMFAHLKDQKIGILGLSYKPNSDVTEQAPGMEISKILISQYGKSIIAYDPIVNAKTIADYNLNIDFADSLDEVLNNVDTLIMTTTYSQFKSIETYKGNKITIIDFWRFLDPANASEFVSIVQYGIGPKI